MKEITQPVLGKWVFAFVIAQWISIPLNNRHVLIALLALQVLDFVTGPAAAYETDLVSSAIGAKGIVRKALTMILLLTAHLIEKISDIELNLEFVGAIGFAVNEAISITENCGRAGLFIPKSLATALIALRDLKGDGATPEQLAQLRGEAAHKEADRGQSKQ